MGERKAESWFSKVPPQSVYVQFKSRLPLSGGPEHLRAIVSEKATFELDLLLSACMRPRVCARMFVYVCMCARMCTELITVPETYCHYSLDVCLQARSPCRVGLMPAKLASWCLCGCMD